jgi:phage shock protein PspC (stress-responsive transcriptional regulator)
VRSSFWQFTAFKIVSVICVLFVILTAAAMFIYPGGTNTAKTTIGYSFTANFFSDLGLTIAHNGQANPVAAIMFLIALGSAGAALMLFFVAFLQFFGRNTVRRTLSVLGTLFGLIAGACFIGVALTPANLFGEAHGNFVRGAFFTFLIAVVFYLIAVLITPNYPNRYAAVFGVFAVLLGFYLILIFAGPESDTVEGLTIQVVGQKIIAYASIITVLIEAIGALQINRSRSVQLADDA